MEATNDFINTIEDDIRVKQKYESYMIKVRDKLYAELDQDAGKSNDIAFGEIDFDVVVTYIIENFGDI